MAGKKVGSAIETVEMMESVLERYEECAREEEREAN